MKAPFLPPLVLALTLGLLSFASGSIRADDDVVATSLVTVADDFIVDIYHDGRVVPDAHRHLLEETFGATTERIDLHVKRGDWIVFHVVNNRIRWDGVYYFAVAGLRGKDLFGFVSRAGSDDWSACDDPAKVADFISDKDYLNDSHVQRISRPWKEGPAFMKQYAGSSWSGDAIWGQSRDTWLKVAIP
jgi:hypothetical protein